MSLRFSFLKNRIPGPLVPKIKDSQLHRTNVMKKMEGRAALGAESKVRIDWLSKSPSPSFHPTYTSSLILHRRLRLHYLRSARAPDKVVAAGSRVRDGARVLAICVEDDSVGAGGAAAVGAAALEGELLEGTCDGEVEAFVVVVGVWVG